MSILQGGATSSTAAEAFYSHTIDQSLRFEDGDSAYLSRTPSVNGDTTEWTWSAWVKRGNLSADAVGVMFHAGPTSGTTVTSFRFLSTDKIRFYNNSAYFDTDAVFRDPSAWYHIVLAFDSDNTIATERAKIYVNGVRQTGTWTGTSGSSYVSAAGYLHTLGYYDFAAWKFDGYMAEVHFTDGTAYTADDFGEWKNDIWVPKDPSVTYGTNGFKLTFADSASIGDDTSGNTNDFTANNLVASDVLPDSPTNNFCTMNSVHNATTLKEGNLKNNFVSNAFRASTSTFAIESGKWYWEETAGGIQGIFCKPDDILTYPGDDSTDNRGIGIRSSNYLYVNNVSTRPFSGGYSGVIGLALDADNNTLKIYNGDGTLFYTIDISDPHGDANAAKDMTQYKPYYVGGGTVNGGSITYNFGQDSTFAGTQIAGGNTDENGIGDFYHSVPSGYLALCTSNLPDPVIDPAQDMYAGNNFDVVTYVGNGKEQLIGDVVREVPDTYPISNSLRFEAFSDTVLSRTPSAAGDQKTWTYSGWFKRGKTPFPDYASLLHVQDGSWSSGISMGGDGNLLGVAYYQGAWYVEMRSRNKLNNPAEWYHFTLAYDSTQATESDRVKLWVNGVLVTAWSNQQYPSLNGATHINGSLTHTIGAISTTGGYEFDGYLAELHFIDGTAYAASDFGAFDGDGLWYPITPSVTYGSNGFYLDFADSADIGKDVSGNGNHFTTHNLSAHDVVIDTPTNNFAVLNPADKEGNHQVYEGNTWFKVASGDTNWGSARATIGVTSGKWYWEAFNTFTSAGTDEENIIFGMMRKDQNINNYIGASGNPVDGGAGIQFVGANSNAVVRAGSGTYATYTQNLSPDDVVNIAYDADAGKVWFGVNGTYLNSGNPAAGTGASIEGVTCSVDNPMFPAISAYRNYLYGAINCGHDSTFAGELSAGTQSDENGYGEFQNAVPSGFLAICENNIVNDITNVESPNLVWLKRRNSTGHNGVWDSIRGEKSVLLTNSANAENANDEGYDLTGFYKNGFTVGPDNVGTFNTAGSTFVAWMWKGGSQATNTDGSITSTVSANPDAGFSIVSYTGNFTAGATVGHGLTQAPEMIIIKDRDNAYNWQVYHKDLTTDHSLLLNTTAASADYNAWNNSSHSATTFTLGAALGVNTNTADMLAFCFHSVDGFSKVGSYVGNGSADGPFVYTGFRPRWIMIKSTGTQNWYVRDTERDPYNVSDTAVFPDLPNAETTTSNYDIDIVSNGFKHRYSGAGHNASGVTYIYLAFAEQPFKYSNAR